MADPQLDQDLKKAFQDLQTLMLESTQKMKISEMQIEQLKGTIKREKLTQEEINGLEPETKTYESIGRMFLQQPMDIILGNIEEKIRAAEVKVKTIEGNKKHLEGKIQEHQNNIREMVATRHK